MVVSIRSAGPGDDEAVGDLLVRAFEVQYAKKMPGHIVSARRKADLRAQAEKRTDSTVLVADVEGRIVGTVAVYRWGARRSEAWTEGAANLRLLAVDVDHLGRGLSAILLDEAERLAWSWGAPAICLHVRRGVTGVARLYEARGYVRERAGDLDRLPEVFLEAFLLKPRV